MGKHPDVLVIGGGIIGLTSAYFLAKSGLSVEVIDKGDLGREASWAGAGIVPPGNPDRAATPIDHLRAYSSVRFPEFSEELLAQVGIENGFLRCGGIEFLTPDDTDAVALWAAEGIDHEPLSEARIREIEPGLRAYPRTTAFHLPGVCQVRNPWHLRALIAACEAVGVRLSPRTTFVGWGTIRDRAVAVQTASAERKPAGAFVIAGGAWGDLILRPLGVRLGVHPVRGQIVLLNPGKPALTRVVMVGKRYLVPRVDGRVLVGSTEEPEAGFEKGNTPDGLQDLIEFAGQLVPSIAGAEVETAWSGLRPGSPDGMPFLGPVPRQGNVFAAVGHFRAGVQLSIGSAEIVTKLVRGEAPPFPINAFRLDREPDVTTRPAFRS